MQALQVHLPQARITQLHPEHERWGWGGVGGGGGRGPQRCHRHWPCPLDRCPITSLCCFPPAVLLHSPACVPKNSMQTAHHQLPLAKVAHESPCLLQSKLHINPEAAMPTCRVAKHRTRRTRHRPCRTRQRWRASGGCCGHTGSCCRLVVEPLMHTCSGLMLHGCSMWVCMRAKSAQGYS